MLRTGELLDPLEGLCHGASPVGSRLAVAVSYRAAWSLPGPALHRLVDVSFHENALDDPSRLLSGALALGAPVLRLTSSSVT